MADPIPSDRRKADRGPPPGVAERRSWKPTYENKITLGNILQTGSFILGAIGIAVGSIFGAGIYVQHLREQATAAEKIASQEAATGARMVDLLQKIVAERSAK